MSLIFESNTVSHHPEQPATHVLLVGCGEYPNLAATGYAGLPPLTSPRHSVNAMADWFLSGPDGYAPAPGLPCDKAFYNPVAPLGSVELLASPATDYITPAGAARKIERPTLLNIRAAYKRWLSRLGTKVDNCGVFYFCGHGVGNGTDQILIADDFGDVPGEHWSATFHVSNTCQVTIRKTSAHLTFLIDACMTFDPDIVFQVGIPNSLVQGSTKGEALCSEWVVLRGATTHCAAYAVPNDLARFTKALLQALKGHCGTQRTGQARLFDVTPSQLREASGAFLELQQRPGGAKRQKVAVPYGEGVCAFPLHVLTHRPRALVHLDVDPPGYRRALRAFMERAGTPRVFKLFNGGPAQFEAEWGEWSYGIDAVSGNDFTEQVIANQWLFKPVEPYRFIIP